MKSAILCVHGFCEQSEMWKHWIDVWPEGLRPVLCPDLPGFGQHASLPVPESMEEMARWMATWLDEKGIKRVIWIGHSMGGYAGAAFASAFPERTEALVMFHSTFRADSEEKKVNRRKTIAFVQEHGPDLFLKQFTPLLFNQGKSIHPEWLEMASAWVKNTPSTSIISASRAMMSRRDYTDWLQKTDIPVCIIAGVGDAHIPYRDLIAQAGLMKRGSLVLLEQSGHLGMLEEAQNSAEAVRAFLERFL